MHLRYMFVRVVKFLSRSLQNCAEWPNSMNMRTQTVNFTNFYLDMKITNQWFNIATVFRVTNLMGNCGYLGSTIESTVLLSQS